MSQRYNLQLAVLALMILTGVAFQHKADHHRIEKAGSYTVLEAGQPT